MGRGRIPTALVRRWLLRGTLVGGAVGAALVLGGPAQAAETTPPAPVTGLLGGLTTAVDDVSGAALDLATGTVDQVLAPVARPVDAVVAEVVRPAVDVVDAVPLPAEGVALPSPHRTTATVSDVIAASPVATQNAAGATSSISLAGAPAVSVPTAAAGSPGSSGHVPAGPRPAPDAVPGSGTVSGSSGLVGPDLVARGSGRAVLSTDLGGVRPLAPDEALAASRAPVPPFSPD